MYSRAGNVSLPAGLDLPNSAAVSITRLPYHAETDAYDRRLCPSRHTALRHDGTVGSNRDEFVVVRKMKNIDWLDGEEQ